MTNDEEAVQRRALAGKELRVAIFDHLLETVGAREVIRRLGQHLSPPSPLDPNLSLRVTEEAILLLGRASEWVLRDVAIDNDPPAWRYRWRTNLQGQVVDDVVVPPWDAVRMAARVSEPADIQLAARDARCVWHDATAAFLKGAGEKFEIFGRNEPIGRFRLVDANLVRRMRYDAATNVADVDGVPIHALHASPLAVPMPASRPPKVERTLAFLVSQYGDLEMLPLGRDIRKAVDKAGLVVSDTTIAKAKRAGRASGALPS